MDFLQKSIIDKITSYKKISIFYHEIPDFDTLGSSFAMRRFIKNKFPEKEVEIIGFDVLDPAFEKDFFQFDNTHIPNEHITDSLGIILDVANETRIWTGRHKYCKELVRIDHHPRLESFANLEMIDENASSTCELVALLFYEWDPNCVDLITAGYLYAGLITDTARFLYPSTRKETLEIASKLVGLKFNRDKLYRSLYLKSLKQSKFESFIVSLLKTNKKLKFGYAVIPKNSYKKYDIGLKMSMVHVFNNIKELEVWATFYYDDTVNKWRGSIRSRNLPINTVAEKFHGGGHKLAAGFTLTSFRQHKALIKELTSYIKTMKEDLREVN